MSKQVQAAKSLTPALRGTTGVPESRQRASPRIQLDGKSGEPAAVGIDDPDHAGGFALLMDAIGTKDEAFLAGLLRHLVNAGVQGQEMDGAAEANVNFLLSVVKGIEPKDEIEAMLAAQMAAVHSATMTFARRIKHVEHLAQQDGAERSFNKLARTFASQVEALKRYRSRGEQTVRVEHVTVNEGGQAIVGNIATGEGRGGKKS